MTRRDDLEALAARVEALTGPCRRVDARIYMALNPTEQTIIGEKPGRFPQEPIFGLITDLANMAENSQDPRDIANFISAPCFTASIDAAMTLASDRRTTQLGGPLAMLRWAIEILEKAGETADALSRYVTAASLRARATQEQDA